MPKISPDTLQFFIGNLFEASGTPSAHADQVAKSLVKANLAGHDSHGVVRVPQYLEMIQQGTLDPKAEPSIVSERGAVTMLDAHKGFGQVAARRAIQVTIDKAPIHGLAATGLYNSGHVGRLGEWTEMAAKEGGIGLGFCNTGRPGGLVAPFGGAERRFGTNPISAAVPQEGSPPVLIDFATSVVAEGKIRVAKNAGNPIPEGRILNAQGDQTTEPNDLYGGGMLLPAAEHKGYSLALLMDMLGGILTSGGAAALPTFGAVNGVLFIVLDIQAFRPLADYLTESAALTAKIKETPPAPGFEEVLIPGEPELRSTEERQRHGIPLDETTWSDLVDAADARGVAVPEGI
ncbi:MAG: Ldh family oxidoreductase [Chloroflexota bacterium]